MNECLVCGGTYGKSRLAGLLQCNSCGFVTANLSLTSEQLKALYDRSYFEGEEYRDYVAERALIEKNFRLKLNKLLTYAASSRTKHLLEVGCAYGFFLSVASEHFYSVEGIDISKDAVHYARTDLNLDAKEVEFIDFVPDRPPDVVCMWDTVEHLVDPAGYIGKAAAIMPKGSVLALTTGDAGSLVARLRGSRWRQIHPPTHLHYFSAATMTKLLTRMGFVVKYSGYSGQYRSLDTIAYVILMIKHKNPALYQALKRSGILGFSLYLNLFDIMYVIAERR